MDCTVHVPYSCYRKKTMEDRSDIVLISQICGITPFEKVPLNELFSRSPTIVPIDDTPNLFSDNNF